jgi:hypothetical protein
VTELLFVAVVLAVCIGAVGVAFTVAGVLGFAACQLSRAFSNPRKEHQ